MKTGSFEKRLWQLADGTLPERSRPGLEKALDESPTLRRKLDEITRLQTLLSKEMYRFSPGFASRTMEHVRQQQVSLVLRPEEILPDIQKVFRRIFLTGVAAAVLLLIGFYLTAGNLSVESLIGFDRLSDDNLISYLLYEF